MIVRWVHPRKIDSTGKLKPGAFPMSGIRESITLKSDGKCSREAISLNDFDLLTMANALKANEAACRFCKNRVDSTHQWNDKEGCDCENANMGARGAIATKDTLRHIRFCIQDNTNQDNPLHVLLCACSDQNAEALKEMPIEKIQKLLIDNFSNVESVQSIFDKESKLLEKN